MSIRKSYWHRFSSGYAVVMDTQWAAQKMTIVVATLLLGGCDLDLGDDKGNADEGGQNAEEGGETEGSMDVCEDGADEDEDGICDAQDLCNEAKGTHCFELGIEMPATLSQHSIKDGGRFDALANADIRLGATLEVSGMMESGSCQGEAGMQAKGLVMQVVEVNAVSTNPDAQAYLDAEMLTEFSAEGVTPAARYVATGGDTPQLQIAFMAGLPPGHVFLLTDAWTYSPECGQANADSVIEGSGGMFRIDHATAEGVSDRIEGAGADYRLYPIGSE
jgi:hypothetical protein